jgi:hypothetical protein
MKLILVAIRLHEIGDRRAFLQEFGIRDDVELEVRAAALESAV